MSRQTRFADPAELIAEAEAALAAPGRDFLTVADMTDEMREALRVGIAEWAADGAR